MVSKLLMSLLQESFVHVMVACIESLAGVADAVQQLVDRMPGADSCPAVCPAHCGPGAPEAQSDALAWRAARVRHQGLHDSVLAANRLFGPFNLVSGAHRLVEGIVYLYLGTVVMVRYLRDLTSLNATERYSVLLTELWGVYYLGWLIFICFVGEQVNLEVSFLAQRCL